jgi:DNA-binding HxlR family transcriptional regulator
MPQVPPPKRHPYAQWSPDARALDLVGDKWTLLIVRDLASGPRRFVELQRVLPGISTEQLRSRLNRMVADGMLTRQRYREVPPRVDYELTSRAKDLLPVLAELAKWGYQWAWSAPRGGERVDIGAIFRLSGGLLDASDTGGCVQFTVTDADAEDGPALFTVNLGPIDVTVVEEPAAAPNATASASTAGWVRAFGPAPDLSGLTVEGDESLVRAIVNQLAQEQIQVAAQQRDAELGEQDVAAQPDVAGQQVA